MKKVTILPVSESNGDTSYCAVAEDKQSVGKTAGEALDSLTLQFAIHEIDSLVIVQNMRPDPFFTSGQQKQLADLMTRWRIARDTGQTLSNDEQANLNVLIEAELQASEKRALAVSENLDQ
jgi:hypothetical protein